jgi:hypothetical protein
MASLREGNPSSQNKVTLEPYSQSNGGGAPISDKVKPWGGTSLILMRGESSWGSLDWNMEKIQRQ